MIQKWKIELTALIGSTQNLTKHDYEMLVLALAHEVNAFAKRHDRIVIEPASLHLNVAKEQT